MVWVFSLPLLKEKKGGGAGKIYKNLPFGSKLSDSLSPPHGNRHRIVHHVDRVVDIRRRDE